MGHVEEGDLDREDRRRLYVIFGSKTTRKSIVLLALDLLDHLTIRTRDILIEEVAKLLTAM